MGQVAVWVVVQGLPADVFVFVEVGFGSVFVCRGPVEDVGILIPVAKAVEIPSLDLEHLGTGVAAGVLSMEVHLNSCGHSAGIRIWLNFSLGYILA